VKSATRQRSGRLLKWFSSTISAENTNPQSVVAVSSSGAGTKRPLQTSSSEANDALVNYQASTCSTMSSGFNNSTTWSVLIADGMSPAQHIFGWFLTRRLSEVTLTTRSRISYSLPSSFFKIRSSNSHKREHGWMSFDATTGNIDSIANPPSCKLRKILKQ
jgi:hypothetical protein